MFNLSYVLVWQFTRRKTYRSGSSVCSWIASRISLRASPQCTQGVQPQGFVPGLVPWAVVLLDQNWASRLRRPKQGLYAGMAGRLPSRLVSNSITRWPSRGRGDIPLISGVDNLQGRTIKDPPRAKYQSLKSKHHLNTVHKMQNKRGKGLNRLKQDGS